VTGHVTKHVTKCRRRWETEWICRRQDRRGEKRDGAALMGSGGESSVATRALYYCSTRPNHGVVWCSYMELSCSTTYSLEEWANLTRSLSLSS
jgi:hypothetical protein